MNKQLTKKSIGIAASAALIASVALSGSALAGPGGNNSNKQGPQASLDVMTVCNIDEYAGDLIVDITITDPNAGTDKAQAVLESVTVQGLKKYRGNEWMLSDDKWESLMGDTCEDGASVMIGTTCTVRLDVCSNLGNAKAVNAETSVTLQGPSSKETYLSRCKDDPATLEVDESVLKVADYEHLCN
jgi:hypothetical protein